MKGDIKATIEKPKVRKNSVDKKNKSSLAISTIVVCCNFENEIDAFTENLVKTLDSHKKSYEIVFVEDGSRDTTYEKLTHISNSDSRIKVIKMRSEFGEASAFDAAMQLTRGEKVVYLTTRVKINPEGLPNLIKKLDEDYDLVVGKRFPRRDSKLNQFISGAFNYVVNKLSGASLSDINSGVFVAKKSLLENIPFYGDLNKFLPLLAIRQGYKVTEEEIEQLPAQFRQSKYVNEYLQRILDIVTIFFLLNYSKKPLHFLGFFGAIFAIAGGAINIYLFMYRLFIGAIAGRPLLLLGTLFFVIGIQMISIGLIGEIIIFTHAKEIKEYNIEKILK